MATIGYMNLDRDTGSYDGQLTTLALQAKVRMVPVGEKKSERAPDFRIYSGKAEVGAAWIKQNQETGNDYVSCKFDDPSLVQPIYANLGRAADQDDDDLFAVIWNRPGE